MWLLVARQPRPDAAYWPGRRLLAALDAVAWPALAPLVVVYSPIPTGVAGQLAISLAVFVGLRRVGRAVGHNERYRFTTWRLGLLLGALLLIGVGLKLALGLPTGF